MEHRQSIARDLFFLLTKASGWEEGAGSRQQAISAGAITDLVLAGRVEIGEQKDPTVTVLDMSPTGDRVLDHVLQAVGQLDGKKLSSLIGHRKIDPTEVIGTDLAAAGAVEHKKGFFGTRWPEIDSRFEDALRRHLAEVLEGRAEPTPQDAIVLATLKAQDAAHSVLKEDVPQMRKKDVQERIDDILEHAPTVEAVKRSFDAMQAAVLTTTVIVPGIITST